MRRPIKEMMERLEAISVYEDVPFGRVHLIFDAEESYGNDVLKYKGYLALSDAFKCHFLETVEAVNADIRPMVKNPLPESYALFVPRIVSNFSGLCAAERVAIKGYPYQGYTLLRNVFDSIVLTSGALQNLASFYDVMGVVPGEEFDPKASKQLRKITEYEVRRLMSGSKSGLSNDTIDELKLWDDLFDFETHNAMLSATHAVGWMKGAASLPVIPKFDEGAFALFMNRYCEISWMLHRLVPMQQPDGIHLSDSWGEKWVVIDESFEQMVHSLTEQLGKKIGRAVVEFVTAKFPFSAKSSFPRDT